MPAIVLIVVVVRYRRRCWWRCCRWWWSVRAMSSSLPANITSHHHPAMKLTRLPLARAYSHHILENSSCQKRLTASLENTRAATEPHITTYIVHWCKMLNRHAIYIYVICICIERITQYKTSVLYSLDDGPRNAICLCGHLTVVWGEVCYRNREKGRTKKKRVLYTLYYIWTMFGSVCFVCDVHVMWRLACAKQVFMYDKRVCVLYVCECWTSFGVLVFWVNVWCVCVCFCIREGSVSRFQIQHLPFSSRKWAHVTRAPQHCCVLSLLSIVRVRI